MGKSRGACRTFVVKPEGKRPLGKPRRKWEDNIHTSLQEIGWGKSTVFIWLMTGTGVRFL
jgi:hypothetical protein